VGEPCPCGSGRPYDACCGPLHDGEAAATAEALMRSRYAAYALGRTDHVFRTWHPRTRPDDLSTAQVSWLGLEVVRTEDGRAGDDTGVVEFVARYQGPRGVQELHEVSRFERRGGRWVYVDGDVS
jgi:SEC-C motif-containing protein